VIAPVSSSGSDGPPERSEGATPTDIPELAPEFAGETPVGAAGRTVQVAYCHTSKSSHSWHTSMMNMYAYDKAIGSNALQSAPYMVDCSGPNGLVEGRNLAAAHFLDETDADWLFWIDTDMGFQPDALDLMLDVAEPNERPVIGGLCFALKKTEPDAYNGWKTQPLPTMFGLAKDKNGSIGYVNRSVYPRGKVVQVAGTGSAFILIHRSVLEAIRAKMGDVWYELIQYDNGKKISEDLSFCWRVGEAGFSIYVHTGVKTTHHKEVWIGEADYRMPEVDAVFGTEREGDAYSAG
jgi:hypothetical protein